MLYSQMGIVGKPERQLHESGKGMRKTSDAKPLGDAGGKPSRKLYQVILAILLLAALLAFVVYSLAVAAIVCRILNWKQQQLQQQQQQQQVAPETTPKTGSYPSNDTSISSNGTVTGACNIRVTPFRQLLSASTVVLIIFNSVAALVLLESLMLLPIVNACGRPAADRTRRRAGSVTSDESEHASKDSISAPAQMRGAARDTEAVRTTMTTAFAFSDMEPCQQHTNDFILRLTYKTRCRDHLVIRVRLPTTNSSSTLGFPRTSGFLDETTSSWTEQQLVDAQDIDRPDDESNLAAASGSKSGTNRGSGRIPEQNAMRLVSPSVHWKTGTNLGQVNETETGSWERRAPRKSRTIY